MTENQPTSEITLYLTEDGTTRVEVRLQNESVWLTLAQMADLFQRDKSSIFKHVQNSFAEDELSSPSALVESTRSELYCICQRSP
ncbi:MAG: death-on-curing protein [Acidobacteria bacterium]|nr:death-on-curing protein [Acidobacteriota bacterium]